MFLRPNQITSSIVINPSNIQLPTQDISAITPQEGMFTYNSSERKITFFDGTSWQNVGFLHQDLDLGTINKITNFRYSGYYSSVRRYDLLNNVYAGTVQPNDHIILCKPSSTIYPLTVYLPSPVGSKREIVIKNISNTYPVILSSNVVVSIGQTNGNLTFSNTILPGESFKLVDLTLQYSFDNHNHWVKID